MTAELKKRNELVESAMESIHNVAWMVLRRFRANVEVEDLIQHGCLGAMQAAEKFDPSKGIPFPAFAYLRIRGAMYDSVRRRKYADLSMLSVEELDGPGQTTAEEDGAYRKELEVLDEAEIVRAIDDQRRLRKVARAMDALSPKQRSVVRIHYLEDKTLREAGEEIGVSSPRAAQIRGEAIDQLRFAMKQNAALEQIALKTRDAEKHTRLIQGNDRHDAAPVVKKDAA
jgi:RNA polymerase sigma factor FliA